MTRKRPYTGRKRRRSAKPKPKPEELGINLQNESSLHAAVKRWLARPGDRLEAKVDGFVVDIVRRGLLIEVQTANFTSIRRKLRKLVEGHRVRLVFPVAKEKWLVRLSPETGEVLGRRKSPRRGQPRELFDELVRIPDLMSHANFGIDVLMVQTEEYRCRDGQGSWHRKGDSIRGRNLLDVLETLEFRAPGDFLSFVPHEIEEPFTNRQLASAADIRMFDAQRVTYCLKKMGALAEVGKQGNALLFERAA
jgi:hypothetical protein